MFRTTLKNLAARKLRLFTTSFAVLLGVAFMAGTLVLTDTIGKTFDKLYSDVNKGTDAYVRAEVAFDSEWFGAQRPRLDTTLIDQINAVDGVAVAEGSIEAYAQLVDKAGRPIGNPNMGSPVLGASWLSNDDLNPFNLASGRAPQADDEVVIDNASANKGDFVVGDSTTVLTQSGPKHVEIVGIAKFGDTDSPAGASYTMFTPAAAQAYLTHPGKIDAIKIVADPGVSETELVQRISTVVPQGTEVLTGTEITKEAQLDAKEGMGFFDVFLMVFALIALFVGSFIIYNSFTILVAQRTREMALMRAIGASRRQVTRSVLLEAGVVGLIASALGLAAGVGVASGLKMLLSGLGIDIPAGGVVLTTSTVILSVIAGLGVSIASAVFPARRAAKVPPIAAMREVAVDNSSSSRKRAVIGTLITGLGGAAMAAGLFGGAGIAPLGLGAMLIFVGVAVLGPILARPLSRILGSPLPRLKGVSGTLARQNAMRNPKRTSATAAALMIGVALVGFITILASSTKASVAANVERTFNGDLVVSSNVGGAGGLSPDLASRLSALPELDAVTGFRMAPAEIDGAGDNLVAADPTAVQEITDLGLAQGSLSDLHSSEIAVFQDTADDNGWAIGQNIPVRFAETGVQNFTLVATYTEHATVGDYLISIEAYDANIADHFDSKVLMTIADGVDADAARAAVTTVADSYPQGDVQDRAEYSKAQTKNMDMLLNLIYALLALAVFIALLGIANTLALSIFERTRELGLLRAVGMTRRQLRATVRYESVIIALLGTTLGLAIGTAFGWSIVKALEDKGLDTFAFPTSQLAVVAVIAGLAGVAAAALPARRAARLDILGAITSN
jgi:putative ABC transport system permease protein